MLNRQTDRIESFVIRDSLKEVVFKKQIKSEKFEKFEKIKSDKGLRKFSSVLQKFKIQIHRG